MKFLRAVAIAALPIMILSVPSHAGVGGAEGTSPSTNGRVGRWVDGDTLEVRSGVRVRLIGIDTPERGECLYETATNIANNLAPRGSEVRLVNPTSVVNRDRYGRLLRYVVRAGNDVGLRQIKRGSKARYDGLDGYQRHPRQRIYRRTDRQRADYSCGGGGTGGGGSSQCAPGYSRCVPPPPPDLNCSDVRAPISVTGSDPHRFDSDGDGIGCESASGSGY